MSRKALPIVERLGISDWWKSRIPYSNFISPSKLEIHTILRGILNKFNYIVSAPIQFYTYEKFSHVFVLIKENLQKSLLTKKRFTGKKKKKINIATFYTIQPNRFHSIFGISRSNIPSSILLIKPYNFWYYTSGMKSHHKFSKVESWYTKSKLNMVKFLNSYLDTKYRSKIEPWKIYYSLLNVKAKKISLQASTLVYLSQYLNKWIHTYLNYNLAISIRELFNPGLQFTAPMYQDMIINSTMSLPSVSRNLVKSIPKILTLKPGINKRSSLQRKGYFKGTKRGVNLNENTRTKNEIKNCRNSI